MTSKVPALLGIVAGALTGWTLVRELRADRRVPDPNARMYVLEREERIAAPVEKVFAFFEEPKNLGELTPPGMNFDITHVEKLPMRAGTAISYTITPSGVPMSWTTEIVEYEASRGFVDLQVAGPYRYWWHRHTFEADGDGTIMRDRVEYQMPFGPLGRLAHTLVVKRQLEGIFDYRTEAVRGLFPDRAGEGSLA